MKMRVVWPGSCWLLDVVGGGEDSGSQVTQSTHQNWTSMVRMVRMVQISRMVGMTSLLVMVGMARVLRIMKVVRLAEMAIIKKWAKKKRDGPIVVIRHRNLQTCQTTFLIKI